VANLLIILLLIPNFVACSYFAIYSADLISNATAHSAVLAADCAIVPVPQASGASRSG